MYCTKCGKEIKDGSKFCEFCGADVSGEKSNPTITNPTVELTNSSVATEAPVQTASSNKKSNGFAVAGLVCSFIMPLLGWIFGGIGLSRANKRNGKFKGFSIAAIVISTVMFFVGVFMNLSLI